MRERLFLLSKEGQGLVEYALVLVLVALVVFVIVAVFGAGVGDLFSRVTSQIP